jgi:hypothetical protein
LSITLEKESLVEALVRMLFNNDAVNHLIQIT